MKPLQDAWDLAEAGATGHEGEGKAILEAWTAADAKVTELEGAASGDSTTSDLTAALKVFTDNTAAAVAAVGEQRDRVEALVTA